MGRRIVGIRHVGAGLQRLTAGTWRDGHMSYHSLVADPPFPLVLAADFGMLLIHLSLGLRPSVPVLYRYSSSSVCHAFPP